MDKIKFTYTEEINLSLKAVFLLKIFYRLPRKTMYTSQSYDWMRRSFNAGCIWTGSRDEHRSTDLAFSELRDYNLIESVEVSEGSYCQYRVSDKGDALYSKIIRRNTKIYDNLISENFFR